jgi:hypothetical protein
MPLNPLRFLTGRSAGVPAQHPLHQRPSYPADLAARAQVLRMEALCAVFGAIPPPPFARKGEHYVYVLLRADRFCLYVGQSQNLSFRIRDHRDRFGQDVVSMLVMACRDQHQANVRELLLIDELQPPCNAIGTRAYEDRRRARRLLATDVAQNTADLRSGRRYADPPELPGRHPRPAQLADPGGPAVTPSLAREVAGVRPSSRQSTQNSSGRRSAQNSAGQYSAGRPRPPRSGAPGSASGSRSGLDSGQATG